MRTARAWKPVEMPMVSIRLGKDEASRPTELLPYQCSSHSEAFQIFDGLYYTDALQCDVASRRYAVYDSDDEESRQGVDAEPREEHDRGPEGGEEEDVVSPDSISEDWGKTRSALVCVRSNRELTAGSDSPYRTRRIASDQHIRPLLDPSFLDRECSAKVQEEKVPKGEAEGRKGRQKVDGVSGECAPVKEVFLRGRLFEHGSTGAEAQQDCGE